AQSLWEWLDRGAREPTAAAVRRAWRGRRGAGRELHGRRARSDHPQSRLRGVEPGRLRVRCSWGPSRGGMESCRARPHRVTFKTLFDLTVRDALSYRGLSLRADPAPSL